MLHRGPVLSVLLLLLSSATTADISVTDDTGNTISLAQPAQTIISLAPSITELLFAAGAGKFVSATVRHSDYPSQAMGLPVIGDAHSIDIERISAIDPDLIVLWQTGTPAPVAENLIRLGYPLYRAEPDTLEKIASSIVRFGQLGGTSNIADAVGTAFMEQVQDLSRTYAGKAKVTVFFQFWNGPIYTINHRHLINQVITLCGGQNVFADLSVLTPRVSLETVLDLNPDIIIASGEAGETSMWLEAWTAWPELKAVRQHQLYTIPPHLILRHSPRILQGMTMMCESIDNVRRGSPADR